MTVSTFRSLLIRMVLLAGILVVAAGAALAQGGMEQRVALVIGNADYDYVPRLANPVNDARDIAAALVPVDACRNNLFAPAMARTVATRSIKRGLGRIGPVGGVLVGYAAREGTQALDGRGRNSPCAQALPRHIGEPGLEIGKLFRKVRDTVYVYQLTGGRQKPYTYGSLPGVDIYLSPPEAQQAAAPAAGTGVEAAHGIVTAYLRADLADTIGGLTAFLSDIRSRVYGRYRSAFDGETMNAGMRRAGLDLIALPAERVRQMQRALNSRGINIGAVDGQIGPRRIQALTAVQRASRLPPQDCPRGPRCLLAVGSTAVFPPAISLPHPEPSPAASTRTRPPRLKGTGA